MLCTRAMVLLTCNLTVSTQRTVDTVFVAVFVTVFVTVLLLCLLLCLLLK